MEITYYKTWDNIGRRYLIKINMDDEWRLPPTPPYCSTEGRTFDPISRTYHPPPFTMMPRNPLPVFWDREEGRWIFKVTKVKMSEEADGSEDDEEDATADTDVGLDMNSVRTKYF